MREGKSVFYGDFSNTESTALGKQGCGYQSVAGTGKPPMTIEEQVERFVRLHLHNAHMERPDFLARKNLHALLRSFLEESCEVADGIPFVTFTEVCERFNEHFAWLEK